MPENSETSTQFENPTVGGSGPDGACQAQQEGASGCVARENGTQTMKPAKWARPLRVSAEWTWRTPDALKDALFDLASSCAGWKPTRRHLQLTVGNLEVPNGR